MFSMTVRGTLHVLDDSAGNVARKALRLLRYGSRDCFVVALLATKEGSENNDRSKSGSFYCGLA